MSIWTWENVMLSHRFCSFEDPVTQQMTSKIDFNLIYGPALRELFDNDTDVKVDLLFEENPIVEGEWRLTDDDSRMDIYDLAVEMELIDSRDEICAGETKMTKRKRMEKEKNKVKLREKPSTSVLKAMTLEQQISRLGWVKERLAQAISGKERKRLEREHRGLVKVLQNSI